ncbi:putative Major latex protein [Hibiscus syriacus]|uniref:Major latex protein n=1 Tax=Hibiscus syriacus TaxID=106335 RepID=A0A6A3BV47_HIBSY|nr:putative Major latex protein [Hibiscus syriacus]
MQKTRKNTAFDRRDVVHSFKAINILSFPKFIVPKRYFSSKPRAKSIASTATSFIPFRGDGRRASFSSSPPKTALHKTLRFSFPSRSSTVISVKSSRTVNYNEVLVDEEMDKIWRLQNGSDVRGVALEGEKGRTVDLTAAAVEAIAESFGEWVISALEKERGRPVEDVKVSLRKDPRVSGASLSVCRPCSSRLLDMTASHLPYTRNGLKLFTGKGGLTSPEVEEICDKAASKYANRLTKVSTMLSSPPKRVEFMRAYAKHLQDIIIERVNHLILRFLHMGCVDKLGADTFGSLHLNPDGMFPNHIPNPEDKTAMALTRAAVLENSANLGIVFNTDVDRSGVVDNKGNPINGDKLTALMSAIVLKEHPGTTVVTDARGSLERGRHRNTSHDLMMETSGHGAYMVVKIIIEMVRMKLEGSNEGIGSLINDLKEPSESVELRMNIISETKYAKSRGTELIEAFRSYIEEGKLEGWELDSCGDCWVSEGCLVDTNDSPTAIDAHMYRAKVSNEKDEEIGWMHIRQSIHNPNIAINMQSLVPGGCLQMTRVLIDKFLLASGMAKFLDISQVDKYATNGKMS